MITFTTQSALIIKIPVEITIPFEDSFMNESRQGSELLKELQQMIAEELGQSSPRAFQPITDGLGLASPRKPEVSAPLPPLTENLRNPKVFEPPPKPTYPNSPVERMFSTPPAKMSPRSTSLTPTPPPAAKPEVRVVESTLLTQMEPHPSVELSVTVNTATDTPIVPPNPPPMPIVGLGRQFFAFVIDQIFVWTTWLFALVVTLKTLMGQSGLQMPGTGSFQDPLFLRFAIVEFATLWLGYLAIGIGVVDMTFGMWVWGIRVRFDAASQDVRLIQKSLRIVASFLFYATILPSLLLMLRRKGRNLLDVISGTSLYRTMV